MSKLLFYIRAFQLAAQGSVCNPQAPAQSPFPAVFQLAARVARLPFPFPAFVSCPLPLGGVRQCSSQARHLGRGLGAYMQRCTGGLPVCKSSGEGRGRSSICIVWCTAQWEREHPCAACMSTAGDAVHPWTWLGLGGNVPGQRVAGVGNMARLMQPPVIKKLDSPALHCCEVQ